jgi:acyl-CoA synthetase (AMP-forming)/AMP-acid ligase II
VAGLPDPDLGSRVTAWIVPKAGARCRGADLRRFCRQRLAGFKVPKEIRFAAELPRNSSGKLLRRCLPQLGEGESPRQLGRD